MDKCLHGIEAGSARRDQGLLPFRIIELELREYAVDFGGVIRCQRPLTTDSARTNDMQRAPNQADDRNNGALRNLIVQYQPSRVKSSMRQCALTCNIVRCLFIAIVRLIT